MKRIFVLVLPLVIMAFSTADWITVKLDSRVSLDFPIQPEFSDASGNPIWTATQDSSFKCLGMIIDFTKFGVDSAAIAKELEGEAFYEQFKTSMLQQMNGATVVSEEVVKVKNRPAYKLTVALGKNGMNMDRAYITNIFVGDKMYSLSFYENTARAQLISRNKFFESFSVK